MNRAYNTFLSSLAVSYVTFSGAGFASEVDDLLTQLKTAESNEAQRVANEVLERWSRSGSPAMDHLLRRGRDAMEAEDYRAAVDHLTALVDHAPDFAEGYAARATAFFLMERYGPAMADLEMALILNPDHFGVLSATGAVLEQIDRPQAAIRALEAALEVHPHMPQVREALARLARKTGGTSL